MCATLEWRYRYADHISNGLMMATTIATMILSTNEHADITNARCYSGSPTNEPLRTHIAMLPKFPTKFFHVTVIWHMMSLARCYCANPLISDPM
jgi:hypothetical protein